MKDNNGQRQQRGGWIYDDGEGGYAKTTPRGRAYILQTSYSTWTLELTIGGRRDDSYYDTLREAKIEADRYLDK